MTAINKNEHYFTYIQDHKKKQTNKSYNWRNNIDALNPIYLETKIKFCGPIMTSSLLLDLGKNKKITSFSHLKGNYYYHHHKYYNLHMQLYNFWHLLYKIRNLLWIWLRSATSFCRFCATCCHKRFTTTTLPFWVWIDKYKFRSAPKKKNKYK